MGILNVTPDSFSDGGLYDDVNAAIVQAKHMRDHGVDILDIGGQSTKPNAVDVSLEEELHRVIPVVKAIRADRNFDTIMISIDTTKAIVAKEVIAAGADMINDVSGATFDDDMLSTVAVLNVPIILMHLRGTPKTMQQLTQYDDLTSDPGIGFAKTSEQSLQLLQELAKFKILNCPILVGTSRKSFIGKILGESDPSKRVWGTAATCCGAIANGANILRVHDVAEMYDVLRVADAIWRR